MADKNVAEVLTAWGMAFLIEPFRDADIDQSAFEALRESPDIIAALIPSLGKRAIFNKKYKSHMEIVDIANIGVPILVDITTPEASQSTTFDAVPDLDGIAAIDYSPNLEGESTAILPVTIPLTPEECTTLNEKNDTADFVASACASGSLKSSSAVLHQSTPKKTRANLMLYPCLMPQLSKKLLSNIETDGVLVHTNQLVRECSSFLLSIEAKPKPTQYQNLARTVTSEYPALQDKHNTSKAWGSFVTQLSNSVRNGRCYAKRNEKSWTERKLIFKKSMIIEQEISPLQASCSNVEVDLDDLLDELQNKNMKRDVSHTKNLIKMTANARRTMIINAPSVKNIIERFSFLRNFDLFLYDYLVSFQMDLEVLKKNYEKCIDKLSKLFPSEAKGTPASNLHLLHKVEKILMPKNFVKLNPKSLITICKVQTGLEHLQSWEGQGLCVIVYRTDDGLLTDIVFVAEGNVLFKTTDTCDAEVTIALIGGYFLLDSTFPKAQEGFLNFLQKEILNIQAATFKQNLTYSKFIQKYSQV